MCASVKYGAKNLYLAGCIARSVIVLYGVKYGFAHARQTLENSSK